MDWYFYFVQFIGLIACIFLIYSFYGKDTNHILLIQIISTLLFGIHYFLLGAYSGLLICFYEIVRDYLYYKTDADNYIFIGSIVVYIISIFVTFTSILDIFPYLSSTIDGYFLTKKRNMVVIGGIVTYTLWLFYNIYVKSYSAIFADIVIIISNLYILISKKEESKITNRKN